MSFLELIITILIKIGKPIYRTGEVAKEFIRKKIRSGLRILQFKKIKIRIKRRYFVLSVVLGCLLIGGRWFYVNIFKDLPNVNEINNLPALSSKILDRNGNLLYQFYNDQNRTWVSLKEIPKSLIEATVAIEDKNFYQHHGISIKGAIGAIFYDLRNPGQENLRGGSTITQQLIKNVFLNNEKTWKRKIKEAILAVLLEEKLSKDQILERYFNQVSYGGEAYGVQEAAIKYFGKNVKDLDLAESAFLAGLPAAPSSYSPFGNNPEYGILRQKHVLEEMVNMRDIDQKQVDEVMKEKLNIINNETKIEAPHFVFYIKKILEEKYGYTNFEKMGLTVTTSLDLNVQKTTEEIVKEEVNKIKNLKISNGAALVLDPKNGDILAMVGSKDYYSNEIDGKYNVTTALRQPGSSIKPINYLLALEKGMNFTDMIVDEPVTYNIPGQKPYSPKDYTGSYLGQVSLRTALASSLNIPSVKLLAQNGVNNMIDLAQKMGITTWNDRSRFGFSLALGAGEIKMTELAGAYSIFANLGDKVEVNPILKMDNYLGKTIYQKENKNEHLIDPGYAFLINDVLSDNQARSPIFGMNSKLVIPGKTVAVKTGTTNNLKDNWCIGWTPSILVATWVGNNDNTPMSWVASGVTGATPIWNRIMTELLKNKINENWPIPNNIYKENICNWNEYVIVGTKIKKVCLTPTPTTSP